MSELKKKTRKKVLRRIKKYIKYATDKELVDLFEFIVIDSRREQNGEND